MLFRSKRDNAPQPAADRPELKPVEEPELKRDRKPGSWRALYSELELREINGEFWYLAVLFVAVILLFILIAFFDPNRVAGGPSLRLYGFAIVSGLLGGWVLTTAWLIDAVAKGHWDDGHHLWRCLKPFIAASLAFATYATIRSGLFQVLSPSSIATPSAAISVGFLVGYFCDRAIDKLGDIANTLFGAKQEIGDNPKQNAGKTAGGKGGGPAEDDKHE